MINQTDNSIYTDHYQIKEYKTIKWDDSYDLLGIGSDQYPIMRVNYSNSKCEPSVLEPILELQKYPLLHKRC